MPRARGNAGSKIATGYRRTVRSTFTAPLTQYMRGVASEGYRAFDNDASSACEVGCAARLSVNSAVRAPHVNELMRNATRPFRRTMLSPGQYVTRSRTAERRRVAPDLAISHRFRRQRGYGAGIASDLRISDRNQSETAGDGLGDCDPRVRRRDRRAQNPVCPLRTSPRARRAGKPERT